MMRMVALYVSVLIVSLSSGALAQTDEDSAVEGADADEAPEVIQVQGQTRKDRLEDSADAVNVINTERDRKKTADLGEILARTKGIGVRRGGGLGSVSQLSLNGLIDDQIRVFLDGVPLEFAGYTQGFANIPVNLIESIEVYRGVVPIDFGADALGGALNFVTPKIDGNRAAVSYQGGSFGTHRATLDGQLFDDDSGWFMRLSGYYDRTDNDYRITVEIPGPQGQGSLPQRVRRFHDSYEAWGTNVETGILEREWADRLTLKGFYTQLDQDIQNNVLQTIPYGEPVFNDYTAGATLRYEHRFSETLDVDITAGVSRQRIGFVDLSDCRYNWFGECFVRLPTTGEISGAPQDNVLRDTNLYARINVGYEVAVDHWLRLSLAPTSVTREDENRLLGSNTVRDSVASERDLFTGVAGLEYETSLWSDRLRNSFFVKGYFQSLRSVEPLRGGTSARRDRDTEEYGVGNALRVRIRDGLVAKASYELATRLPRVDEVFGNGVLIQPNLEIEPERSQNANLGFTASLQDMELPDVTLEVNGFLRRSEELIVLLAQLDQFRFENVLEATSIGVETSARWVVPGEFLTLGGNLTYLDFRNRSTEGRFARNEGDRIPNRPYLSANAFAQLEFDDLFRLDDTLAFDWNSRYVEEFFRTFESDGLREFKETIDSQLQHSLAVIYTLALWPNEFSFTAEVQNLTNERLFDFFGVERPGRAFFFKTTAEL
ncbi:MAG: TonB-dependent receptor plug domain-containing protein [Myxococcota bacterium]